MKKTGVFGSVRGNKILWGVVALIILGCGGAGSGGGGTSVTRELGDMCAAGTPPKTLVYNTNWGLAPGSASQIVQVLDASGSVIRTESFNRGGTNSSQLQMTNLNAGVYELRARMFSESLGTGTELASTSEVIDLCGSDGTISVSTSYDGFASSVLLRPANMTISIGENQRAIATVKTQTGASRFIQAGTLEWSIDPTSVASVSNIGVVTGNAFGEASLTATWTTGSLSASRTVTVADANATRSKWTVLVYMNAANDLFAASDLNMNQMEQVAGNEQVRFVVQWKQSRDDYPGSSFDGVRRYLVKPDNTNNIASELVENNVVNGMGQPVDMGSTQSLRDFVDWGRARYPADRYVLIIWNHGNGWKRSLTENGGTRGFSYDDQYETSIQTWEIDDALMGRHFDILAWDASLMQMAEVAYEARTFADYVVGSEESPPADGYPYHSIFDEFRDNPDKSTRELTNEFVTAMTAHPPYVTRKITQSSIDTSRMAALAAAVDNLAGALIADVGNLDTVIPPIRQNSQSYSDNSTRRYRDLIDVAQRLANDAGTSVSVKAAAQSVIQAANAAIVWEGHNDQSPGSRGLAIDFMSKDLYPALGTDYQQLQWAQDTRWDEWLQVAP